MSSFKDKYGEWGVVTGGTSGIGYALVNLMAERGLNIVLVARRENLLAEKAEQIRQKYKVEVKTIQADLTKSEDVAKVTDGTDGLEVGLAIPCAGIENHGVFTDIDPAKELAMLQLNIVATYQLTRHFAESMVARKRGGIMLVASLIGHMPNPYFSNYAGSKAYIINLGTSLHWEMKQRGVDVTVLSPGFTDTPMTAVLNDDFDISKLPMTPMSPEETAALGLAGLGKSPLVIPGKKNKMMAFMATRLFSTAAAISSGGKMMEKVMPSLR